MLYVAAAANVEATGNAVASFLRSTRKVDTIRPLPFVEAQPRVCRFGPWELDTNLWVKKGILS